MPLNNPTLFYQLLGPYSTRAEIYAYRPAVPGGQPGGGGGKGYIDRYEAKEPTSRTTYDVDGNGIITLPAMHQYDAAARSYAFYAMTGDEAYLTWANSLAVAWRDYAISIDCKTNPAYTEIRGVALHYAATGDTTSQTTVGKIADWFIADGATFGYYYRTGQVWLGGVVGNGTTPSTEGWDIRIWTRGWEACMYAHAIGAPSPGIAGWSAGGNNFETYTNNYLDLIYDAQYPDGIWRCASEQLLIGGTDYTNAVYDPNTLVIRTFFNNLVCNASLDYLRLVGSDSRIMPAILSVMTYIYESTAYDGLWDTTTAAIAAVDGGLPIYIETDCGFPDPAGIAGTPEHATGVGQAALAGLAFRATARLYQTTGNDIWKTRADQLLAGQSLFDFYEGSPKFLNEGYTPSFNGFPDLLATPGTRTIRLRGI